MDTRGVSVVEVIIGTAVFVAVVGVVTNMYARLTEAVLDNTQTLQATLLLEEGGEVVRIMRDNGWGSFLAGVDLNTPYYYSFDGSNWSLATTTPVYVDGIFLRSVAFDEVYRDGNDVIAQSGTLDPNTREAVVSVSWSEETGTTTQTQTLYISNIFD